MPRRGKTENTHRDIDKKERAHPFDKQERGRKKGTTVQHLTITKEEERLIKWGREKKGHQASLDGSKKERQDPFPLLFKILRGGTRLIILF